MKTKKFLVLYDSVLIGIGQVCVSKAYRNVKSPKKNELKSRYFIWIFFVVVVYFHEGKSKSLTQEASY